MYIYKLKKIIGFYYSIWLLKIFFPKLESGVRQFLSKIG